MSALDLLGDIWTNRRFAANGKGRIVKDGSFQMGISPKPEDILRFLADRDAETTLVTLVNIAGSASRAVGSQMAVAGDGSHCGSLSGGCVDAAIAAEALDALAAGHGRIVRFGAGSPYIDVKLPCGGGIDLMFTPRPDRAVIQDALRSLSARRAFGMTVSVDGIGPTLGDAQPVAEEHFDLTYHPSLRLAAIGQGDDLSALVRLASGFGADVVVVSPQEQAPDLGGLQNVTLIAAPSRYTLPAFPTDQWTAIVFLFHDRDWEEHLVPQALEREAFYHGAVGSPRTQDTRRQMLSGSAVLADNIAKLRNSVGLIPSTRDPATLAMSILAELVAEYAALVARPNS